jgi:hypothetical protein
MLYAKINEETNEVIEFPIYENDLRNDIFSGATLPREITDFSLVGTPYRCVKPLLVSDIGITASYTHSIEAVGASYNEETGEFDREYGLVQVTPHKLEKRKEYRLNQLRMKRDAAFAKLDAKILRYESQVRLGVTPTDDIAELDAKAQELRDVTEVENPWAIEDSTFFDI